MDNLISRSTTSHLYSKNYERKLSNYLLFNNIIDQKDFDAEMNPFGLSVGQIQDEVKPYNKTYNKIKVLQGDELMRPFNYRAVLVNPEGLRSKLEFKSALVRNFAMNEIQKLFDGLNTLYPKEIVDQSLPVLMPNDIDRYMSLNYRDNKEILAQSILTYLEKALSLKELKNDAFKHGLISGEEYVYIGYKNAMPVVKVLNPLNIFYEKSNETKYVQDGSFAGYKSYMTISDIISYYGNALTEKQLEDLASKGHATQEVRHQESILFDTPFAQQTTTSSYQSNNTTSTELVTVYHVEWRSLKKVYFYTFFNEYGDSEYLQVDENFPIPENAIKENVKKALGITTKTYMWLDEEGTPHKLEEAWVPQIWEGTRINDDIYTMIGPKEYQFFNEDDPNSVTLGYHGVSYSAMNAPSISLMDRMKPFQYLYIVIMHKLKKLIAQDNGKVFQFDITMVDPKIGVEKTLYYLQQMNLDIYNPLMNAEKAGSAQRGKVTSTADMSNAQHIANYVALLDAIDSQIADVAGVTRQREGHISANEAVTNANSTMAMSAVVTEIEFFTHAKLWEKVLNYLINLTQQLWKDKSIVKQYVLADNSLQTLKIEPFELSNASYGVFVSDSGKENQLFQQMQQLSQMAINSAGAKLSDIIKLYKSYSVEELESHFEASEKRQQQEIEAQREHEQTLNQQNLEAAAEQAQLQREHEVLLKQIDSFKFVQEQDSDNNGVPDQLEVMKFITDTKLKQRELDIKEKQANKPKSTT